MKPFLFFDLETTGVDKAIDKIVEIAIVRFDGEKRYEYHTLINPTIPIPKGASDIHGITDEMVKDKPTFLQIVKTIHNIFSGCDIYGYNSNAFDIPLLVAELARFGYSLDFDGINFIDPCVIFKRKEERTLTAALKFYCHKDHDGAHGAMADVLATIEVMDAQKQYYAELTTMPIEELNTYCNYDKERADIAGCFTIADGEYVLNFGKHKGQMAKDQVSYLQWMFNQDFMPDTKAIISKFI